jgi:putative phosphoesterase
VDDHLIGLIADTHGLVRPDVHTALAGVHVILHAGDVGGDEVLDELALIAPVHAVFGNTDPAWATRLTPELIYPVGGVTIHVSHGHEVGSPIPAKLVERYPQSVLVFGHTHRQLITRVGDQLVINPGAAGPRRFKLVPSVARLRVRDRSVEAEIIDLAE